MDQIITIVLPVFGLIGIGYAIAWSRLLDERTGEALADFVFTIAIPILIFRTLATADFSAAEPWRLWLPFFSGFALAWVAGHVMIRRLFGRDHRAGLVGGIASSYGNEALVGLPLVITAYGEDGAVAMALIIAVHLPIMMSVSAFLIERAERLDGVATADRQPVRRGWLRAWREGLQPIRLSSASSLLFFGGSRACRSAAFRRRWSIVSPRWRVHWR